MRDIPTQIVGGTYTPDEHNDMITELESIIINSGQTLSAGDLRQVEKAVSIYAAGGSYYVDSGTANAYVLSPIGSKTAPNAYFTGMLVRFRPGNANTGASTINVAALGVKNIKKADGSTDPDSGDISTTSDTTLVYNGTNFLLLNTQLSNLSLSGNLNVSGNYNKLWEKLDSIIVSGSPVSTINFTSLLGDTDLVYKINANVIPTSSATGDILIRFNNDTGNNYGDNVLQNSRVGGVIGATNSAQSGMGKAASVHLQGAYNTMYNIIIFAESGAVRTAMIEILMRAGEAVSTVPEVNAQVHSMWTNTSSEITSIQMTSTSGTYIDVGSKFDIWARRA